MTSLRVLFHFIKHKNFNLGNEKSKNLIIVGSKNESTRVMGLIHQAQLVKNFIGTVSPNGTNDSKTYLSNLQQLDEVVHIYKIDEIIFLLEGCFFTGYHEMDDIAWLRNKL